MQRKLIATLVASALAVYAASAAQAACPADGATAFSAGPVDPVSGYAQYVTDSNGLSLERCLSGDGATGLCFFDPVIADNYFSAQIGSGTESFFYLADAKMSVAATGFSALAVMGAEATFNIEAPLDGQQLTFTRLRIRIDAPAPGLYTVTHPYGQETYPVTLVGAGNEINETIDISFSPDTQANVGRVGPWLSWDPAVGPNPPPGYIGDPAVAHPVVGSPCGTNYLRVSAVDFDGNPINLDGQGGNTVETNLFTVHGKLYTTPQAPIQVRRATYSRLAGGRTQIDTFVDSVASATVTVQDGPGTTATTSRLPVAVALDNDGSQRFQASQILADVPNAATPARLTFSATHGSDKPSVLSVPLVDLVSISRAEYDTTTGLLSVSATSSDTLTRPALTIAELHAPVGTPIALTTPPGRITVTSAAGGSDSVMVRVLTATPPAAPTDLSASVLSPTSVRLNWTDAADNETSYVVLRNGQAVATLAAGSSSYTDNSAQQNTVYQYVVHAANAAGSSPSEAAVVTTPGVPSAPLSLVGQVLSASSVRLSWTDTANTESSFEVQQSSNGGTSWVNAATGLAVDSNGLDVAVSNGNTYLFRVAAVNEWGRSTYATSAPVAVMYAPSAPSNPAALVSGQTVTVSWSHDPADQSESGFAVEGSLNGAAYVPVGTAAANAASLTLNNVAAGNWTYRVRATGVGGNSAYAGPTTAVNVVQTVVFTVAAPTATSAVPTSTTVLALTWQDRSSNENRFRIERSVNGGAWALLSNVSSTNNQRLNANRTVTANVAVSMGNSYQFRVRGETTAGGLSDYATFGTVNMSLPAPTGLSASFSATGLPTVRWNDNSLIETSFLVQRCAGTCTDASAWTQLGTVSTTSGSLGPVALTPANNAGNRVAAGATVSYRVLPRIGTNTGAGTILTLRR